jgi:hypothetical protein
MKKTGSLEVLPPLDAHVQLGPARTPADLGGSGAVLATVSPGIDRA